MFYRCYSSDFLLAGENGKQHFYPRIYIYIFLLAFAANSAVIRGRPVLHSRNTS